MEAKELRIGNRVKRLFNANTALPTEWGEINISALNFGELQNYEHWYQPVLLTEEWLLKFGWRYYNGKNTGDMTMDTPCKLDIDWVGGKMCVKGHYESGETYRPLRIEYVHQIQNLYFALTGEELTTKQTNHGNTKKN